MKKSNLVFLTIAFVFFFTTANASFTEISFFPNIQTIGIIVSGSSLEDNALMEFRQIGDSDWLLGHPLTLIDDGRLAGSLFSLRAATSYEVKVTQNGVEISGIVSTKEENLTFLPSSTIYIDAAASPGGDGSYAAPFQTIQEGVNASAPGTEILVNNGVYHEEVNFLSSGTPNNWIRVKANGSAVILDGSLPLYGDIWTPHPTENNVWFYDLGSSSDRFYMAKDNQEQVYRYPDMNGLILGQGLDETDMPEGWFKEENTSILYVRSTDNPASHSWQLADKNYAFNAEGNDWIWIQGFEIKYFGANQEGRGIRFNNCSHVVIRNNTLKNNLQGIDICWDGSANQGNDTRIENNNISDFPVDSWPWDAVKHSTAETSGIILAGHQQAIVRNNELHNLFNGIYVGRWEDLENTELCTDVDVYNNRIHHIGDDGLEPEGACINNRFHHNNFNFGLVPMSLAPITYGPVWVLRNQFSNYNGTGLKFGIEEYNPDGKVFVYHNTIWTDSLHNGNIVETMPAVTYYERSDNWKMRNNIFRGTWYALRHKVPADLVGHDWDYNNWYTTQGEDFFIMKDDSIYQSTTDFYAATGLEQHGYIHPPGLSNPYGNDFHLQPISQNIDAGILIPGINDNFQGTAPDVGAYEDGHLTALSLKVFLQGPLDANTLLMNDNLRQNQSISLTSPYAYYNFLEINSGGETMASSAMAVIGNDAIVDWLLIELRDGNNPSIVIETKAALLQRDGDVVDLDGVSLPRFENIPIDQIFVAIRHRNHFGIQTASSFSTGEEISIDFTDPSVPLHGISPAINIASVRAMISGDANHDGQINPVDKNNFWRIENGVPFDYLNTKADFNLDGIVNPVDLNGYWRTNNSKIEQLD